MFSICSFIVNALRQITTRQPTMAAVTLAFGWAVQLKRHDEMVALGRGFLYHM